MVKGYTDRVEIFYQDELIARHERSWKKEGVKFKPLHYLALLERKPGALDFARPLEGWELPESFGVLRRRLEQEEERKGEGTREYIRVLLLLREYPLRRVAMAVEQSLDWTSPTADAIKQWLIPVERPELMTFRLAGREHLAGVRVARTELAAYSQLREVAYV